MDIVQLLHSLNTAGIELRRDAGSLKVSGPPQAITPELAEALRQYKPQLLELLSEIPSTAGRLDPGLRPAVDRGVCPLTPEQERNLQAARRGPGLLWAFRISGQLNPGLLAQSLQGVVDRQSILRGRVVDLGDETQMRIAPEMEAPLVVFDLTEEALPATLSEIAARLFDVNAGPLCRFSLAQISPWDHVLILGFSQVVFDGYSLEIFLRELTESYSSLEAGSSVGLPPLSFEFLDYSAWRRERIQMVKDTEKAWWLEVLGREVPAAPIPVDKPRPLVPSYQGQALDFDLSPQLVSSLRLLARGLDATVQMVLLSAAFILIRRLSCREDCWLATPIEGRRDLVFEKIIGPFSQMTLLRVPVLDQERFEALLAKVRGLFIQALDHQVVALEHLDLVVQTSHTTGTAPLYQFEFNYQQSSGQNRSLGALEMIPLPTHSGKAYTELSLQVDDSGVGISASFEFATEVYDRSTIRHWKEIYLSILQNIVDRIGDPLGQWDVLSPEKQFVLNTTEQALRRRPFWFSPFGLLHPSDFLVVDEQSRPVPVGTWGWLQLRGKNLGKPIRLRAEGVWERPVNRTVPQKGKKHLRTRVFDPVEFQIIKLFETALSLDTVGLHDDFFEKGGHSLLGVRIMNGLRRHFGVPLALGVLFEAPTPFLLAKIVRREAHLPDPDTGEVVDAVASSGTTIVPIQPNGSRIPFFVAAGLGGNPMNLRYISKYLGEDQPFFGLQHPGADGRQAPHNRIEEFVQEYILGIRKIQPRGPYLLGGFSAGGTAIFEVARELVRQGDSVALIVMFDANSPTVRQQQVASRQKAFERWKTIKPRLLVGILRHRYDSFVDQTAIRIGSFLARFDRFRFREQAVKAAWMHAMRTYSAHPLNVDVLVFRAKVRDLGLLDATNGWKELVLGNLRIVEAEGGHITHILPPNIEEIAQILRAELGAHQ